MRKIPPLNKGENEWNKLNFYNYKIVPPYGVDFKFWINGKVIIVYNPLVNLKSMPIMKHL